MVSEVKHLTPVTTENGVVIRNLTKVDDARYSQGYSFTFQALIDNEWWDCNGPCGDWSFVKNHPSQMSVSVGWWELNRIYHDT